MQNKINCQCPSCGRQYSVGPEYLNRKAKCQVCGNVFTVSQPAATPPRAPVQPPPAPVQPQQAAAMQPPPAPVQPSQAAAVQPPPAPVRPPQAAAVQPPPAPASPPRPPVAPPPPPPQDPMQQLSAAVRPAPAVPPPAAPPPSAVQQQPQESMRAPTAPEPAEPSGESMGVTCVICGLDVCKGEEHGKCTECKSFYHTECWKYNGGCGVYGCSKTPEVEKLGDAEVPLSYWGIEQKSCARCNNMIQAAAKRCRFCGLVFESARPQTRAELRRELEKKRKTPAYKRDAVLLFISSLISCTAPLAVLIGSFWIMKNKKELKNASGVHFALSIVAVAAASLHTFIIVLIALLN